MQGGSEEWAGRGENFASHFRRQINKQSIFRDGGH